MAMFSPLDDYDRKTLVDMAVEADLTACKRLRGIVGKQERLDGPGMRGHRRQFGAEEFCRLFNLKLSKPVTIPMALLDETAPNMENYIGAKPKARKKAVPFGDAQDYDNRGRPIPAGRRFQPWIQFAQPAHQEAIPNPHPEVEADNPVEAQPAPPRRKFIRIERDGNVVQVPEQEADFFLARGWRRFPAPPPMMPPQAAGIAFADAVAQMQQAILADLQAPPPEAPRMQDELDRQMQQIAYEDPF